MAEPVEDALLALRAAIKATVRQEQLRDRLTTLGNDEALTEWLEAAVAESSDRWVAFLEVDRFKRLNDTYGYDDADEILRRIADHLRAAAKNNFPRGTAPYRAHGDEFYLTGPLGSQTAEGIERSLNALRENVAAVSVEVASASDAPSLAPMTCTVSVGWTLFSDIRNAGKDLTARSIRGVLELACAEAKVDRNNVVRFDAAMAKKPTVDGRSDCPSCRTKFAFQRPESVAAPEHVLCPVCGTQCQG